MNVAASTQFKVNILTVVSPPTNATQNSAPVSTHPQNSPENTARVDVSHLSLPGKLLGSPPAQGQSPTRITTATTRVTTEKTRRGSLAEVSLGPARSETITQ
ncbi:hypothetical protein RRG08_001096 [Elysia crispata]|uniref:Uncharacterized protein n=1 Tax=Elysia crispata TaxID=231223 RepID=A0AAE1AW95_9GAST|nr:hypothetical protein RRG08_001096 [Elysia crispata]